MAATDIQYGDFSPVLNTVDYSFLRYVLDKKTGQYEQGLKSVSSSYNSLKKDLSDPTNVQKRDQYLKNAQGQLQKMAGSDLSLQANVNAANDVFEPMATDKAFLIDSYYTASNKKELAEMDAWRNSDDLETRKKFNPKIYNWLASDLDSIKNGNGDISKYKVKDRKAFAYLDAQDLLNKAVKDSGFTVSKDIDGGTYVLGVEGGKEFKQNYKTFANEVLRGNSVYQQQNQILGESSYESIIKEGQASGKSEKQSLSEFVDGNYTAIKDSRNKYVTDIREDIDKQKKDLIAETNGAPDENTTEGQAKLHEIAAKRQKYEEDLKQLGVLQSDYDSQFGSDKTTTDAKKATYMENFLANPKGFFSQQYSDNDINTFSNIRSQSEKTTIKPNTAYFNALTAVNTAQKTDASIKNAIENTEIKADAQDLKEQHEEWIEGGKPIAGKTFGKTTATGAMETISVTNPDGSVTTSKQAKKPQISYVGPSGVDITKTMATLNAYTSHINTETASSISNLASAPNGGALTILNTMGVKRENIQTVRGYFIKQQEQAIKDPSKPYKADNAEAAALKDVYSSMFAFAKQNKNEAALTKLRAEYGKDARDIDFHGILDLAISQTKFKDIKDYDYVKQWKAHKKNNENISILSASLATGKKAVIAHYSTNPDFNGIIIKDKNGKSDLIGEDSIYDKLKNVKNIYIGGTGIFTDDTGAFSDDLKKKIAKGYIDGSVKVDVEPGYIAGAAASWHDGRVTMQIDGKKYYYQLGQSDSSNFPMSSDMYKKRMDQINSEVLLPETSPEFKQELMASPIWNINGAMKQTILSSLVPVTQYSSNIKESDGGSGFKQTDTGEQNAARAAMADPKNIAENGVYIHSMSGSNNGGVSVAVTFNQGTDKEVKAGCKYCGKTYYFPIDVVKGTPEVLQAFNTVNEQTEYNNIKNTGKTYDLYNYEKMGIKVQMLPHTAGSDTGDVLVTVQKQDPVTHAYIPDQYETVEEHYDLGSGTVTELKEEIYNKMVSPYISTRLNFEKQQSTASGGGAAITKAQILKGL